MNYANSTQTEPSAPMNPIPAAMSQLGTAVHEMGLASETLANRLGVVMMPMPPQPASKGETLAAAPPPVSPQADEINGYRRRIENITAQLQDVLNRLEV